jgi:exosortase family protein XrtF
MFGIYSYYLFLTQEKEPMFECAPITRVVGEQAVSILSFFGFDAELAQHDKELSIKLFLKDVYLARVIEGCNSLSIIILFIAFIIAFPGSFKKTFLYAVFGSLIIYGVNILRISFLTIALGKLPQQKELLHNLVFPSIIYGLVFLLWVIWVNFFSNYKEVRDEKNS